MQNPHPRRAIGPLLLVGTLLVLVGLAHHVLDQQTVEPAAAVAESESLAPAGPSAKEASRELGEAATGERGLSPAFGPEDDAPMPGVDAQVASAPARDIGPYLDPDVPLSAQGAPEDTEPQDIGPALDPDASPKREQ